MNDYLNLLKEYDEMKSNYSSIKSDYKTFESYINQFISSILSLNKCIINIENLKDNSLIFFTEKFNNTVKKINQIISFENIDMIAPLKQVCESQDIYMKNILESYNKIKNDLFEGKLKLTNAKNEYINILKENTKEKETKIIENGDTDDLFKSEDNLLYDAKKDSYFTLYKYQVEKLNEKITKSNKKYKELKPELNSMYAMQENTYKIVILKFAKMAGDIGNIFIELKKNLEEKLFKVLNENQEFENENEEIKDRFEKEKLEAKEYFENKVKEVKEKNNLKENIITINNNINIEDNNNKQLNEIILNKTECVKKKSIDGLDFEIVSGPMSSEDPLLIKLINEVIKKLNGDEEISSSEISQLLEIIKFDSDCTLKFIEETKKFFKNKIININNKQNFFHFSNIINELILAKNNQRSEIINGLIELSPLIKYNNIYLSSIIRKKNKILNTKGFWSNLIEKDLINTITKYIEDINNKSIEIHTQKYENKKTPEKILNILNNILSYKKVKKIYKTQVEEYIGEQALLIISKSILNMCNFSVHHDTIMDIFNQYVAELELGIEPYYYFENLLSIKFQKNYLKINISQENSKEKFGTILNKEQLIILNAAIFLPKQEYISLFKINKLTYSKLRKCLIKYRLSLNISLDERISLWEILLNVQDIQKKYNYTSIKNEFINKYSQETKDISSDKSKNLNVIDLDLERTPLFRNQKEHKIKAGYILKIASLIEPDINYYQGMNYVLLFLYQILNYDEEKSFYFFWAIQKETKFHEIFIDDMKSLVNLFKIYEKIIEINYKEIYDSLYEKQIMTQFYATQWFITLFTFNVEEFEKDKPPKLILLAFESFLCNGWSGIINMGLAISLFKKDKIIKGNGSDLMRYMIQDLYNIMNISEEDYFDIKKLFISNSKQINEIYVKKLMEILTFEEDHPQLKSKEI